ncbi:uncharacterized protein TNCV_5100211 [Trichonephila clavipes]|uniref:Uncharacterized protein n=1 Tax=Trichonephila clavipes TaxID=2585209 RepID=A0A8X6S083_TRICX|nr:uncharacterized protein TNCV_5100211 [Trichonephila clavipes]
MLIKVNDAIREKRIKELKRKVVLFHQDDVRPNVNAMTSWTLYSLEWDSMQHPPSDYYLFLHLQLHLEGTIFHLNDKVINEVRDGASSFAAPGKEVKCCPFITKIKRDNLNPSHD